MNKEKLLRTIVEGLKKEGAVKIGLFGSYARGEQKRKSDIDILVKFAKPKSLLEFVGIEQELSEKTGKKIELLTEEFISPHIIGKIKKEIVELG